MDKLPKKGDFRSTATTENLDRIGAQAAQSEDAKVSPDVEAQQLRDGAITAAGGAAGNRRKAMKLMEGHRALGITDKYAMRHPRDGSSR